MVENTIFGGKIEPLGISASYPGGNLLLARYHASTDVGFLVLGQY